MQGWVKIKKKKNRKFLDKKIRISRWDSMVLSQMGSPVEPSGSVPMRLALATPLQDGGGSKLEVGFTL